MKVAHVKTVDGVTTMIQMDIHTHQKFVSFLENINSDYFAWAENGMEVCYIFKDKIISVRFREVAE